MQKLKFLVSFISIPNQFHLPLPFSRSQTVSSNLAENQNPSHPISDSRVSRTLSGSRWLLMTTQRYRWKSGWPSYAVKTVFYVHRGHYHISNGELIEQTYLPSAAASTPPPPHRWALLSSCVNSRIFSDKSGRFWGDQAA